MSKMIICIDFDGVIHSYDSGWKGVDNIPDPPVEGAFGALLEYCENFKVCIYSSRSKEPGGIFAMVEWFKKYGWPLTKDGDLEWLEFPTQKPPAWITIDDRAIQFNGVFPSSEEIKSFKPWNKKD